MNYFYKTQQSMTDHEFKHFQDKMALQREIVTQQQIGTRLSTIDYGLIDIIAENENWVHLNHFFGLTCVYVRPKTITVKRLLLNIWATIKPIGIFVPFEPDNNLLLTMDIFQRTLTRQNLDQIPSIIYDNIIIGHSRESIVRYIHDLLFTIHQMVTQYLSERYVRNANKLESIRYYLYIVIIIFNYIENGLKMLNLSNVDNKIVQYVTYYQLSRDQQTRINILIESLRAKEIIEIDTHEIDQVMEKPWIHISSLFGRICCVGKTLQVNLCEIFDTIDQCPMTPNSLQEVKRILPLMYKVMSSLTLYKIKESLPYELLCIMCQSNHDIADHLNSLAFEVYEKMILYTEAPREEKEQLWKVFKNNLYKLLVSLNTIEQVLDLMERKEHEKEVAEYPIGPGNK